MDYGESKSFIKHAEIDYFIIEKSRMLVYNLECFGLKNLKSAPYLPIISFSL